MPQNSRKGIPVFNVDWCKACGICIAFCPQEVLKEDEKGKARLVDPDGCNSCGLCEVYCPDFAVVIDVPGGDGDDADPGEDESQAAARE
ncbi:MAG: 4Fe-4S binding protein [Firmicutes bacterium]|nr:4Fe-4S binding protein [Bacillota bacterium]